MSEVILKMIEGNLLGEEFVFEDKGSYLIGRSSDCALQIPNDKDMRISRRHFLLILDAPYIRIRDLGSRNGTLVNAEKLAPGEISDDPEKMTPVDRILKSGDVVAIGDTTFTVVVPAEEAPKSIASKKIISHTIPVAQTAIPVKSRAPVTHKFAPVTHVALPDLAKIPPSAASELPSTVTQKSTPVVPLKSPVASKPEPAPPPVIPLASPVASKPEPEPPPPPVIPLAVPPAATKPTPAAPVIPLASPVASKPEIAAPPVIPLAPPVASKPEIAAPPVIPLAPPVASKPESVPVANKLKLKDVNDVKSDKYEQMKEKEKKRKLDSNLPTIEMDAQEFNDMDDLVFQPPAEEKTRKRTTKFKIKGPS